MPLERATIEMKRSLYAKPSVLRVRDKFTGLFTKTLTNPKGLFSHLGYRRNDNIVKFVGTIRSLSEYEVICAKEPLRRSYSLISSEHGVILDCYDQYKNGFCLASYANSPLGCWNTVTNTKATENCRLVITTDEKGNKSFWLRAGIRRNGKQSSRRFFIPPHQELLFHYGDSYIGYED